MKFESSLVSEIASGFDNPRWWLWLAVDPHSWKRLLQSALAPYVVRAMYLTAYLTLFSCQLSAINDFEVFIASLVGTVIWIWGLFIGGAFGLVWALIELPGIIGGKLVAPVRSYVSGQVRQHIRQPINNWSTQCRQRRARLTPMSPPEDRQLSEVPAPDVTADTRSVSAA